MFTHLDRRPGGPDHKAAETGQTGPPRPPRNRPSYLVRFTALPAAGRARGRVLPVAAEVPGPHRHVTWGAAMTTTIPGERGQLTALRGAWQITVGATLGRVPVPGMAPPPAVAMRMPAMIANMR